MAVKTTGFLAPPLAACSVWGPLLSGWSAQDSSGLKKPREKRGLPTELALACTGDLHLPRALATFRGGWRVGNCDKQTDYTLGGSLSTSQGLLGLRTVQELRKNMVKRLLRLEEGMLAPCHHK